MNRFRHRLLMATNIKKREIIRHHEFWGLTNLTTHIKQSCQNKHESDQAFRCNHQFTENREQRNMLNDIMEIESASEKLKDK